MYQAEGGIVIAGLKVNDQLVAYATRFLAVHLKNHEWSHHHTLKAKLQCDFSSTYSPDHTNILQLTNWGDMGSNPAQGKFSFKHLFSLKCDYLGCTGSGVLSYSVHEFKHRNNTTRHQII